LGGDAVAGEVAQVSKIVAVATIGCRGGRVVETAHGESLRSVEIDGGSLY